MKALRVLYLVLLLASLSLAFVFYYQYRLKDKELTYYQQLSRYSDKALEEVSTKLVQSKKKLEKSLKEVEELDRTIAALEKSGLSSKAELQALKAEREKLQIKIVRLTEEKANLERNFISLEKKFHSLEELEKAIGIAKIEKRRNSKSEAIQRRLAKIEMSKRLDEIALRQGNRGYLLRKGSSTFRPRITVELEPVGKWSHRETENK